MGKDARDEGAPPCCHTCERWAGRDAEPVAREVLEVAEPRKLELVVSCGGEVVTTFVPTTPTTMIGRDQRCELPIKDGALSRRQAQIVVRDGRVIVADMKSTCGTYVDGRKISSPQVVGDGAVISFGNHDITIRHR
jgi:pSer/pThr/pTyr-binding forkhead associated (FHA) protein